MPDQIYSIKINREEGVVEISGPDKDWIAEQLDKLTVVFQETPAPQSEKRSKRATPKGGEDPEPDGASNGKQRRRRGGSSRAKRVPELEQKLGSSVRNQLQKWRDERESHFKSLSKQAAIIATFLLDVLKWEDVGPDELYTVYVMMGWPPPGTPKSQLENARARDQYFGPWESGKVKLSHTGERFGRNEAKVPVKKKAK